MMTNQSAARALGIASMAVFLSSAATAHQDPYGAINPTVTVKREFFVVEWWNSEDKHQYRLLSSFDGDYESAPQSLGLMDSSEMLSLKTRDFELASAAGRVIVPRFFRYSEAPYYQLQDATGELQRHELAWGDSSVDWVQDVAVHEEHLAFLVTLRGRPDLHMFLFRMGSGELAASSSFGGEVGRIYKFPVASSLGVTDSVFVVAWLQPGTAIEGPCNDSDMFLTRWDSEEGTMQSELLVEGVHGNTRPALAIAGNRVLVAFHQGRGRRCLHESTIRLARYTFPRKEP